MNHKKNEYLYMLSLKNRNSFFFLLKNEQSINCLLRNYFLFSYIFLIPLFVLIKWEL